MYNWHETKSSESEQSITVNHSLLEFDNIIADKDKQHILWRQTMYLSTE